MQILILFCSSLPTVLLLLKVLLIKNVKQKHMIYDPEFNGTHFERGSVTSECTNQAEIEG